MAQTSLSFISRISRRLKEYRIDYPMTQKELAEKSGVSLRSIQNFENGSDIQFGNLIKLLNSLGLADNLDMLIPDVTQKPSAFLAKTGKRERASHKPTAEKTVFKWGDEQ